MYYMKKKLDSTESQIDNILFIVTMKYWVWLTRFMINVRSPCWSSSSGVGGKGRFGGPGPAPCVADALFESSDKTLKPGLYENSGLTKSNEPKQISNKTKIKRKIQKKFEQRKNEEKTFFFYFLNQNNSNKTIIDCVLI